MSVQGDCICTTVCNRSLHEAREALELYCSSETAGTEAVQDPRIFSSAAGTVYSFIGRKGRGLPGPPAIFIMLVLRLFNYNLDG